MNDLIEKLSSLRSQFNCFNENEREAYHTLSETIKVLSERPEPCEDAVSRQAVLDLIADYDLSMGQVVNCTHALPPVTPKGKWIPVTERLPENKQEVLVTEYGETDIGRRFDGRWVDRYGDKMKDVTAWMPLPEPYSAERRTDERTD